ncbi:ABC transporter substrate-binding protein [Kaistia geumhonensis]|uniref:Raffinose/stachyose/melibiose transport system substrate-binding protein n=1 Tax=Kaistia geumhonensis TaxID=410839 RepID=A0ABU0M6X3_9HYPH|nr:ABC transporter substrate-binding protein [Kaistia geumhonensis]MCX5478073.1 ABC transporter substrate-binding protein [Kaistia geumhonensis]MDQ0516711.1 raffinose/stachyose/melibiose transport system substrate-binding protein [Kaistia geumhonensis]
MTLRITRRSYLVGSAALAGAALSPFLARQAGAAEPLAYKGDLNIVSLQRTPPDQAYRAILAAFEAANPGITIKTTEYPSERFVALLTASLAAGEPVDMLMLNGQDLRRYAVDGTLGPLDGLVGDTARFAPAALATGVVDGKQFGVPYGWYGGFPIFYNRALLEKNGLSEPKSYDDFLAIRDKLKAEGIKTFTHPGKNIYLWPVWFFTTFAQTSKNRSIERTIEILTGKGKFTDQDVVDGLDLVFRFGKDELVTRSVFSLDTPNAVAEFASGKAAFFLQHDGLIQQILSAKPEGVDLDVMLMPNLVGGDVRSQFPGGPAAVLGVPAKVEGDRRAAALALVNALTSNEANAEVVKVNSGTVPVNTAVKGSDTPVVAKLIQLSDGLVTYLDWNWPPEITRVFQEGIQAGVAGQQTGAQVAEKAQATLDRLVGEGYAFK